MATMLNVFCRICPFIKLLGKFLMSVFCFRMSASSQEEREIWIQCIRDSVENNPFSKVIAEKKVAMRQKSIQMQKFPEKNYYKAQDWLNVTQ